MCMLYTTHVVVVIIRKKCDIEAKGWVQVGKLMNANIGHKRVAERYGEINE